MTESSAPSWRQLLTTGLLVFLIAATGCTIAFAFWLRDISAPQVAILGSGNRLSILVADGPARLILATGNDPIAYGNALARFQPLFARRVDVLLLAGQDQSLRVPVAAHADSHTRIAVAVAPLLPSPETAAMGPVSSFSGPRRIRLGTNLSVNVETALPYGSQPAEVFPAWRATIERGTTRIVVLSDGEAAELFPPGQHASALVVAGDDPATAWEVTPAVAFLAHAGAISGPEMREAFSSSAHPPVWGYRISPGEALRIRFVGEGIELPSDSAQALAGDAGD